MLENSPELNYREYQTLPPTQLFDLSHKSIVIFGGSSGIGLGMAAGLGLAGAKLIINGRNSNKLEQSVQWLVDQGINAIPVAGSINDPLLLSKINEIVKSDNQKIFSGMILSAAMFYQEQSFDYPSDKVDILLETNLKSQFFIAQWGGKLLKESGGSIIFLSSGASKKAMPNNSIYSASKGAINSLARTLAVEWARFNIRINTIIPGWIETPMTSFVHTDGNNSTITVYEKIRKSIPSRRWGKPNDFAGIAIWLMSDSSKYVTGAEFVIDGGLTAV